MNQRRHTQAADCGEDRQQRALEIRKLAVVELALELEADKQEKYRHQPIVDPVRYRQTGNIEMPKIQVRPPQGRIRDRKRHRSADDE